MADTKDDGPEVPHTTFYADIKRHLGDVVPCYGQPGGCHMDDSVDCADHGDCLLLKVYIAGYRASKPRCGTCKFLERDYNLEVYMGGDFTHNPRPHKCTRIQHFSNTDKNPTIRPEVLTECVEARDVEGYNAWLMVTEDFGCVLHEPLDTKKGQEQNAADV